MEAMNPQEKAIQIREFFSDIDNTNESAIFMVDMIVSEMKELADITLEASGHYVYWQQVRNEIA